MKICVIIPVYNESKTIADIVQAIKQESLDVVVVDDGSTDGSGEIAKTSGAVILRHKSRSGKGASLRDGFRYALENNYDGVITFDGDGQHDVLDIDSFLKVAQKGNKHILVGNRMSSCESMPYIRYVTNSFMSFLISQICRQSIPDTQCGFRFIHSDVLRKVQLTSNDYEIETEVLIKASKHQFLIESIPIKTIYRDEVSKINPIKDTIRFFGYLIKEMRPQKKL